MKRDDGVLYTQPVSFRLGKVILSLDLTSSQVQELFQFRALDFHGKVVKFTRLRHSEGENPPTRWSIISSTQADTKYREVPVSLYLPQFYRHIIKRATKRSPNLQRCVVNERVINHGFLQADIANASSKIRTANQGVRKIHQVTCILLSGISEFSKYQRLSDRTEVTT